MAAQKKIFYGPTLWPGSKESNDGRLRPLEEFFRGARSAPALKESDAGGYGRSTKFIRGRNASLGGGGRWHRNAEPRKLRHGQLGAGGKEAASPRPNIRRSRI